MSEPITIPLREAARLLGKSPNTFATWARRKGIRFLSNPENGRERLVRVSEIPELMAAYQHEQNSAAIQGATEPLREALTGGENSQQPTLPFAVPQQRVPTAPKTPPAGIPEQHQRTIEKWLSIVGDARNGTWKRYLGHSLAGIAITNYSDFIRATAKLNGKSFAESTIWTKLNDYDAIICDSAIPVEEKLRAFTNSLIPRPRSGRSGHDYFARPENAWQGPKLAAFYLTEAKLSVPRAHELLHNFIRADQQVWGAKRTYNFPSLHQSRMYLSKLDSPTLIYAREGERAYRNRCEVSLSRNPDSLRSDDLWVTDQRVSNVILQDKGHQLGRIWMVNDLDVASFRWLGCAFGPVLDSDMVMTAHTRAIAKDGHLPRAIHHDQGKEFRCTAFNGSFRCISGEALFRESIGFWQRLGVTPVPAIGGNPQSKTIERWHAEVDKFDKCFLTWCGGNTDERPEGLAAIKAQHDAFWFHGEGKDPGIPTIEEYIAAFVDWCE